MSANHCPIAIDHRHHAEGFSSDRRCGWALPPAASRIGSRANVGFTLLELLVVIVIIGLLTAIVGPRFFSQVGKTEQGAARAQIDAFAKAIDAYRLDTGRFPPTEVGLAALMAKPTGEDRWNGPYLQKAVPNDPWGRPYQYAAPGRQGHDYDVWSYGRDGRPGGQQDDADVSFR